MTPKDFQQQIVAAVKAFDRCVVSLDAPPVDFATTLPGLVRKAIAQFEKRAPGMRHGIVLNRHVTVMVSDHHGRVLCNIYFNLHSDYHAHKPESDEE